MMLLGACWALAGCGVSELNDPYPEREEGRPILYQSFSERPKHLDPAKAYSSNEYAFIAQIYEPPLQYHYLKRPYQLVPLTADAMPAVRYLDARENPLPETAAASAIAYTDYIVTLKPGIAYQPHPAFARDPRGRYIYHDLAENRFERWADFRETGSRELLAEDYVYQIKRLAHPKLQSPIAEIMKNYIVGFDRLAHLAADKPLAALKDLPLDGAQTLSRHQYRIRIRGKYPQFLYWLAMPFFAPMPWEADVFYAQPGLNRHNITLDWFPVGTGPYYLAENNPNRRMLLERNPFFHAEYYPGEGEAGDAGRNLLVDAGKPLPFIDKVVFMLERETIPYWNKFLQGYYDASGVASDSFDQAVQFTGAGAVTLTESLREKGIQLQTAVETSSFYMGFNMLDKVLGGYSERAVKLRRAIAIAVDYEEFISIFRNGRGVAAQGVLPPDIFGYDDGRQGINPYVYDWQNGKPRRKSVAEAKKLMAEAGYAGGIDPATGEPLILYFDTVATGADDRPMMNWYRKQLEKLGVKLIIRGTDYNRFQEKMNTGNAQIYVWGWNADYPDPENFFFLLYGPNSKVEHGGENASNYANPEFDALFEKMRNMDNSDERLRLIQQMQDLVRRDAPWVFGFHPKTFSLYHGWFQNLKPNLMANNRLKYLRIEPSARADRRRQWNQAVFWPLGLLALALIALLAPAWLWYRRRLREPSL